MGGPSQLEATKLTKGYQAISAHANILANLSLCCQDELSLLQVYLLQTTKILYCTLAARQRVTTGRLCDSVCVCLCSVLSLTK